VAELEISIKCKSVPAQVGLTAMGALMPFWALFIPFLLGQFIQLVLLNPQLALNPWLCIAVMALLSSIPLMAVLLSAICEDDRILVSKEGLAFPLRYLPGLSFRRERLWSDLQHVGVSWSSTVEFGANDYLTLFFKSGGTVKVGLSQVSKADLEQLLLAVEVWSGEGCRPPELIDFQNTLQNESKGIASLSYTQMWEEELRRRFSATSFVPLEPGHELAAGHLKVVRQLAFGGLSAIYLAQRNNLDLVVVKEAVIPANADVQSREKAYELFKREAMLLTKMDHRQIARVLDHFAQDGRNYLVLEYINGQDLRQLVKQNGSQPVEKVIDWACQIAEILTYLHGQTPPVIHRDLTPDNLVLKEDGTLTLIDFGAANEFVGTATGTLVGKQSYISPEQFRGKAVTQSDIYAFGCTLFFLLSGKDPEALSVSCPVEAGVSVPFELNQLIERCTALEADKRPSTAREIHDLLSQIMPSQPVSAVS
jgi:serine/threonine protein kinase